MVHLHIVEVAESSSEEGRRTAAEANGLRNDPVEEEGHSSAVELHQEGNRMEEVAGSLREEDRKVAGEELRTEAVEGHHNCTVAAAAGEE